MHDVIVAFVIYRIYIVASYKSSDSLFAYSLKIIHEMDTTVQATAELVHIAINF